jgi:hypothetical protein
VIGGGDEQRTLRLVAAYADMWNGFGDLPTIRRKLEVLEGHCRDVGPAQPTAPPVDNPLQASCGCATLPV